LVNIPKKKANTYLHIHITLNSPPFMRKFLLLYPVSTCTILATPTDSLNITQQHTYKYISFGFSFFFFFFLSRPVSNPTSSLFLPCSFYILLFISFILRLFLLSLFSLFASTIVATVPRAYRGDSLFCLPTNQQLV
jgi:hypothetical protein